MTIEGAFRTVVVTEDLFITDTLSTFAQTFPAVTMLQIQCFNNVSDFGSLVYASETLCVQEKHVT